jgi:hypothetical protein
MSILDEIIGVREDNSFLLVLDKRFRGKSPNEIRENFGKEAAPKGEVGFRVEGEKLKRMEFSELPKESVFRGTTITRGLRRMSVFCLPK